MTQLEQKLVSRISAFHDLRHTAGTFLAHTDYYASLLLLRAGLISLEDYVAGYNSLIKEYYTSPIRLLPATEMVQKRQTSYEVERLFYQRGAVLAHHLDAAIRSRTNNKSSLDEVMRSLLKSAKARGLVLSHKRIADG